jgi:hypothetical protein
VDLRPWPLLERKAKLEQLLAGASAGVHFTEYLEGEGAAIFAHACQLGAEGIASKGAAIIRIARGHRRHGSRSRTPPHLACCGSGRSSGETSVAPAHQYRRAGAFHAQQPEGAQPKGSLPGTPENIAPRAGTVLNEPLKRVILACPAMERSAV